MADDRPGPSIDRVREQLRRRDEPDAAPEYEPGSGPDPETVTEVSERVQPPDQPPG